MRTSPAACRQRCGPAAAVFRCARSLRNSSVGFWRSNGPISLLTSARRSDDWRTEVRALALADAGGLALYEELVGLVSNLPTIDMLAVHRMGDRLNRRNGGGTFRLITSLLTRWLEGMIHGAAAGAFPEPVVPGEDAD